MRRGINIRKKKKLILNEINKKSLKLLVLLIALLIVCITVYIFFVQDIFIKINLEEDSTNFSTLNDNIPFSLNKIILFSSATAESSSVNQLLSLNISNYCDIGIYLNKISSIDYSIASLYIDNVSTSSPELGTPYIYQKNVSDLGKCSFDQNNIIKDRFDFNIINTENKINYNNLELYCDGTTPISVGFYNQNVKKDFISDNFEILYNGTLLKEAFVPLSSLNCNVSFRINIITTSNEHYICNVSFDIPFENENSSIYTEGYIIKELNSNEISKFLRIK